jgi:hypothetical protein
MGFKKRKQEESSRNHSYSEYLIDCPVVIIVLIYFIKCKRGCCHYLINNKMEKIKSNITRNQCTEIEETYILDLKMCKNGEYTSKKMVTL